MDQPQVSRERRGMARKDSVAALSSNLDLGGRAPVCMGWVPCAHVILRVGGPVCTTQDGAGRPRMWDLIPWRNAWEERKQVYKVLLYRRYDAVCCTCTSLILRGALQASIITPHLQLRNVHFA